jgi:hypothetical protein
MKNKPLISILIANAKAELELAILSGDKVRAMHLRFQIVDLIRAELHEKESRK